jgi:hypothetical protein
MAQNEAQAGIRTEMGKEMTDIQNKQVQEQSRLRDLGVQLDLGEVEGQQLMARNAEEASTAATQQGIQGVASFAQQGLNMMPLYFKDSGNTSKSKTFDVGGQKMYTTSSNATSNNVNPAFQSKASDQFSNYGPQSAQSYGPMGVNWNGVGGY